MFGKFFSGLLSAILTAVLIFTGQYLNDQMARVLSPPSPAAEKIIQSMLTDDGWERGIVDVQIVNNRLKAKVLRGTFAATVWRNETVLTGLTGDDLKHIHNAFDQAKKAMEDRELANGLQEMEKAAREAGAKPTGKALVKTD